MITLANLENTHRPKKKIQRVGRGTGSKRGKTCCRGGKGYKARTGYKTRAGHEGGQMPLYRKLPTRGFSNQQFQSRAFAINLDIINDYYKDGEVVNFATLREKKLISKQMLNGIKILGNGELTKKVTIEAQYYSASAKEKLTKGSISFKEISLREPA